MIAPEDDSLRSGIALEQIAAESAAERLGERSGQLGGGQAAYVVLAEDVLRDGHGARLYLLRVGARGRVERSFGDLADDDPRQQHPVLRVGFADSDRRSAGADESFRRAAGRAVDGRPSAGALPGDL